MFADIRQTFRWLRQEPGLGVAMLATLTLAIGSMTAVFSVLDAVIIRPLPFREPDQLVAVWQQDRTDRSWFTVSPANFLDWQKESSTFDSLAAVQQFQETDFNLTSARAPEAVKGIRVSADLFRVLDIVPSLGRALTTADSQPGSELAVVLQHDLWAARFGSDPSIVGRTIGLNGEPAIVVGVMPPAFEVPNEVVHAQLLLPIRWSAAERYERRAASYFVIGRLKTGVTVSQASAALDVLARRLERQYPVDNKDTGILVQPLRDQIVGNVRSTLLMVFAAAASVVVLACFNLANLLTARGIKRQRELSVRAALGATRLRLVRQTLTEGFTISVLGGAAALAFGVWAVGAFTRAFTETRYFSLPRRGEIAIDWRVFVFVGLTAAATALLFSVTPARRALKADVVSLLRRPDSPFERRWRSILMAGELAIALMLVAASVQLVRSYERLQGQDRGFQSDDVLTARIALPTARYPSPATRAAFFRRLLSYLESLSNAADVATVQLLPLNGVGSLWSVARPDRKDNLPSAFHFVVSPTYFETMRIPLLAGRSFTSQDVSDRTRVVILSQSASERYFPGENPIGRTLRIEDGAHAQWEVVGIVGDIRNQRLDRAPQPQIYVPMEQSPTAVMTVILRSRDHNVLALAQPLRDAVRAVDAEQGIADLKLMAQVVDDSTARWRMSTDLFVGFGVTALLLALVGVYSVTTFNVALRSREIAVRMALGASRRSIVGLLVRSTAAICGVGLAVGLILSLALARTLSSLLFAVRPVDPVVYGWTGATFTALVLGTTAWSAHRTTNIQPTEALKADL